MNTKANQLRFRNRAKETGQALVLIALMMVILLGMLGLAIDGGGMFLLWRDAQNAVDAAALQAAFAYCTNGEDLPSAQAAGFTATLMNGFDNSGATGGDNWVTVDRATNIVDDDLLPGNVSRKADIILVRIVAEKPSYFIQVLYRGPLRITVTSLGVCNAGGESFFEGYGVYAMGNCPNNVPEVDMSGSQADYWINIGSNGDIDLSGSNTHEAEFHYAGGDETGVEFGVGSTFGDLSKIDTDWGTAPEGSDAGVPVKQYSEYPVLYRWDQFEPGGEIWSEIDMLNGTPGDWTTDENLHYASVSGKYTLSGETQGLWVIDADEVVVDNTFSIGAMGLTLVTNGKIDVSGKGNNKNDANLWKPFTNSTGLTNSLLFFSTFSHDGNYPPDDCATGGGNAAIQLRGSGVIGMGLIYAPYGAIDYSASDSYWCGALIGLTYDSSGSSKYFFNEEVPSEAELRGEDAEDWFFETGYLTEGTNCDFIEESQSEVFLGDLPS